MAPVAATTTGVARQTIDDPKLVDLISRISDFDGRRRCDDAAAAAAADEMTMMVDDVAMAMDADAVGGEGVGTGDESPPSPPLDVEGLAAELDRVPRWQFQEQVSWPLSTTQPGLGRRLSHDGHCRR